MSSRQTRSMPYISKNPSYDSFKCECGALLRMKSPSSIAEHRETKTHKKLVANTSSVPCDIPLKDETADPPPSLDLPADAFVLPPSPSSSIRVSSQFQVFG